MKRVFFDPIEGLCDLIEAKPWVALVLAIGLPFLFYWAARWRYDREYEAKQKIEAHP